MNYLTHQLLNAEEINLIKKELEEANQDWEDGKKTAGSHASKVKNNLQLKRQSDISKKLSLLIKKKLLINCEFFFDTLEFLFNCKLFFTIEA